MTFDLYGKKEKTIPNTTIKCPKNCDDCVLTKNLLTDDLVRACERTLEEFYKENLAEIQKSSLMQSLNAQLNVSRRPKTFEYICEIEEQSVCSKDESDTMSEVEWRLSGELILI